MIATATPMGGAFPKTRTPADFGSVLRELFISNDALARA